MLRASSYNIYVDLPGGRDEIILAHGYSGAYDAVTPGTAKYIRSRETRRPPKPLYGEWGPEPTIDGPVTEPPASTIELLKHRGYLTEMTEEEEESFFSGIVAQIHNFESVGVPLYLFMTTYDCNLRCGYCFQDHMRTNPAFGHLLTRMTPSVVDRIFAAMPILEAHHGLDSAQDLPRHIVFFGGEPLLEANRPIVEYIIAKATRMGRASFSAITNGTDLHAYRDLLGPGCLSALQITLDGPSEEHDKRRVYADGSGSFDRIARHITMALELGVRIEVRTNVDRNNVAELPGLADEIAAYGWDRYSNFLAYASPISSGTDTASRQTTIGSLELDTYITELRKYFPNMRLIDRPDDGLQSRIRLMFEQRSDPFVNFRASFCAAHGKMYVFDPFADIYACWEKTGDARIRIGRVTEAGEIESNVLNNEKWRSRTVTSNPVCRQCRFALYCGGGCAVLALGQKGQFFRNHCDGFQARFRTVVGQAYLEHEAGDAVVVREDRLVY